MTNRKRRNQRVSWLDSKLARLGEALSDPEHRGGATRRLAHFAKKFVTYIFLLYLACTVLGVLLTEWIGERNIFFAFFLFLPSNVWLLPLAFLFPAALLLLHWRLAIAMVLFAAMFVWIYLDWESSGPNKSNGGRDLTVLTFNRGQRIGSLQPFKNAQKPDLIIFQDAGAQAAPYLRDPGYQEFSHGDNIGEFTLLSKYPITEKKLISHNDTVVAARFLIDFGGDPVAIYTVHLPTPRDQLKAYRRGAFLWGILGVPGTPMSEKRKAYQRFWDRHIELADALVEELESETRPFILAGDFNVPAHGYIYRKFARRFKDAHEEAGHGFGYTFPGKTRNPMMLFGPWLRLDHQFASEHWRPLDCITEKGRPSQHLAVSAKYELETD